jgi:hypothetical protein
VTTTADWRTIDAALDHIRVAASSAQLIVLRYGVRDARVAEAVLRIAQQLRRIHDVVEEDQRALTVADQIGDERPDHDDRCHVSEERQPLHVGGSHRPDLTISRSVSSSDRRSVR